jgi:muramoyltetrapeptide carboxypeptidase
VVKPARVPSGAQVALVSPSSRVGKAEIERAEDNVRAMGLEPVRLPNVGKQHGFFAGTDAERAADLNQAFRDPKFAMIWCIRGGYGAARLLPLLDWEAIRKSPKALLGFSDITALHLGLWKRVGLVCFHGPNATSCNTSFERDAVAQALMSHDPIGPLPLPSNAPNPYSLTPGTAEGRLLGGNLAVLSSLIGTEWMPSAKGALLFFEDVSEAPYRIDRFLNQVRQSGLMGEAAGLALGRFTRCDEADPESPWKVADVLKNLSPGVPAAADLPFGHVAEQGVLPIGVRARLSGAALQILESGVQ